MRITVKDLGDHSRALARLQPGHPGAGRGAVRGVDRRAPTGRKVLLIAGGVGITPLRAMFADAAAGSGRP